MRLAVAGVADPAIRDEHPGPHPGAAQQLASRSDVGAVADHAVSDERTRPDPRAEPDDGTFHYRTRFHRGAIEDHRAVQSHPGTDMRPTAHHGAADENRTGRHRRIVVHQALAAAAAKRG